MKKWIIAFAVLLALGLGFLAAGPWLAIRGIHASLQDRDLDRLERYVDFPALRTNLRGQVEARLARATSQFGGGMLGDEARGLVGRISGRAVETMVTPAGIAILLEGRSFARRVTAANETAPASPTVNAAGQPAAYQPLKEARTRFESPTRFTATTESSEGKPVVFVFQMQGLRWRLTDIRLPE